MFMLMRHFLLPVLLSVSVLGMAAATPDESAIRVSTVRNVKISKTKDKSAIAGSLKPAKGIAITKNRLKRIDNRLGSNILKSPVRKGYANAAPQGTVFYESFEGWDGTDAEWLPEGWTRRQTVEDFSQTWGITSADPNLPAPSDGNCYMAVNFGYNQDEWLITPACEIADDMVFSFMAYIEPVFLFSMDNIDWDTMEYEGDKVVAATLQIMVKAEGDADWTMLHDFADDYKDLTLNELFNLSPSGLQRKSISLSDYAGKKVQMALRYTGNDGNTIFIDEVTIGYPQLDGISFMEPFDMQYWGFERSAELSGLSLPVAQIPVFSDETWINTSYIDGADFSWSYCDPVTAQMVDGGNGETLTVQYVPDYTSDNSKRNNFFYPPVLTATAPHATPGTATSPYTVFQAGGKPEYKLSDGMLEVSLMPFLYNQDGITIAVVDSEKFGDATLPIFGHNANTNKYWLDYTLQGDEPEEGDDVQLDGILNFIYPSQAPMVVNGADVFAKGTIADDAVLTLRIFALDDSYVFDPDVQTPLATATCTGVDIIRDDVNGGHNTTLCIPFNFDTPAIVQATDETVAYVVYLTGFNSDKVEYFAPIQSYIPDSNQLCHGWITKRIRILGNTEYRFSATPIADQEGELGKYYNAFAIGLHAEHPWLTCETKNIELPGDGTAVNVPFGSYFDGSKLNVQAPAGVTATVAGRYDECVLTLAHDDTDVIAEGDVTVSGPGVEVTVPLKQQAGISDITAAPEGSTVTGIYDLNGRRADGVVPGMYIVRYSDGTARKMAVK